MSTGTSELLHSEGSAPAEAPLSGEERAIAARSPLQLFWRRFRRDKVAMAATGFIILLVLVAVFAPVIVSVVGAPDPNTQSTKALLMFGAAGFVFAVVFQEFWRGVRARRAQAHEPVPVALVSLVRRNRRRYGGYIVHASVVLLALGIVGSSVYSTTREVKLLPGQTATVDGYRLDRRERREPKAITQ